MIALIVGTNRPGSNSRKVAAHLEGFYAELKVSLPCSPRPIAAGNFFTGFLRGKTQGISTVR